MLMRHGGDVRGRAGQSEDEIPSGTAADGAVKTQISRADLVEPGHEKRPGDQQIDWWGNSAETAGAPRDAAAAATTATATAAASATASATTTATAAAAPCRLHLGVRILLVEQVERRQRHVGNFFFAQRDRMRRGQIDRLRRIGRRHRCSRRSSDHGKAQPGRTECRHRSLDRTLPFRSWLCLWHLQISNSLERFVSIRPILIVRCRFEVRKAGEIFTRCNVLLSFIFVNLISSLSQNRHNRRRCFFVPRRETQVQTRRCRN